MNNEVKIVLENTLAQLEAKKTKAFNDAKNSKTAELNAEYELFVAEQKKTFDEAYAELKSAYDIAIGAKKNEIEEKATIYANTVVNDINATISVLRTQLGLDIE